MTGCKTILLLAHDYLSEAAPRRCFHKKERPFLGTGALGLQPTQPQAPRRACGRGGAYCCTTWLCCTWPFWLTRTTYTPAASGALPS